jgi:hypothetical protein
MENSTGLMLLPCKDNVCQECAVNHLPNQPHNAQSLYYQYKFYAEKGIFPTWKDAVAHCNNETKIAWEKELRKRNVWKD